MCSSDLSVRDEIITMVYYYNYEGAYEGVYLFNDPITSTGEALEVSYKSVGEYTYLVYYMLTDIYQNHYWTEPVKVHY